MSKTYFILIIGGGHCWLLLNNLQCLGHLHNKELCDPKCQWAEVSVACVAAEFKLQSGPPTGSNMRGLSPPCCSRTQSRVTPSYKNKALRSWQIPNESHKGQCSFRVACPTGGLCQPLCTKKCIPRLQQLDYSLIFEEATG